MRSTQLLKPTIILLVSFLFLSQTVFATGTFQLSQFKDSLTTVLYQQSTSNKIPYTHFFYFIYSGDSIPSFSVIRNKFPPGMNFSDIKVGQNGFNSIEFSGTPTTAGNYPLTLVLTDNKGALLTQPFNFKVEEHTINILTDSIPRGTANKPYLGKIDINYSSHPKTGFFPRIIFKNLPEGLQYKVTNTTWLDYNFGTATIEIFGNPIRNGQSQIELSLTQSGLEDERAYNGSYEDFLNRERDNRIKKEYTLIIDEEKLPIVIAKKEVVKPETPKPPINIQTAPPPTPISNNNVIVQNNNKAFVPEKNATKKVVLSDILNNFFRYFISLFNR